MKTKTGLTIALYLFIHITLNAQFTLDGPQQLCVGECGIWQVLDANGEIIEEDFIWDAGDGTTASGPTFEYCYFQPGFYTIIALDPNGNIFAESFVQVVFGINPEIFSFTGGFCESDSLTNCDRVCENTTVTYGTEVSGPGTNITWTVTGADSWEDNGNEVTVSWGSPGQGQVSVTVGDPSTGQWFLSCGSLANAVLGGTDGTGFVYIDGPPGMYEILVSNGVGAINTGNEANEFNDLPAGAYQVWVTDQFGNSQTCQFTIESYDFACQPFGVAFDVTPPTDCNSCDGFIEPIFLGNGSPPFAYEWLGPNGNSNTTGNLSDACAGQYTLMVYDQFGCVSTTNGTIECDLSTGCSGSATLCVDILATPEAAFETNPPANNGVVEICEGQTVFFTNQTIGAFNYTWDFGNAVSSSSVDAEYTYLSSGTYEALLIARNDCYCGDTSSVTIIVEESISPEIDCAGTICPGEEVTYTSNADCGTFYWNVSSNGTIISGGGTNDDFITVDWGAGPTGLIELSVDNCNGDYCTETLFETIPIIDDNAEINGPERVCKGAEVIYSMPAFAGTEFNWQVSSFGTITEGWGTNEISVQWADEVTPVQQHIIVQYESCYLGCGGQDTLFVHILNEIFIEGPIVTCPEEMATYTCRTPLGNSVQANWTIYDNVGAVVFTSPGAVADFDVNWAFGSGNYTVHADVLNPTNYCIDNFSIFVEVVPETNLPLFITGPTEICPGISYAYTGNSGGGSYDYTWYVSDGGFNYILNGQTVNIIWGNTPPFTLALTQTNLQGFSCESESIEISPNIINAVSLNGTSSVCLEEIGTYTATDYENLDYTWQVSPSDAGSVISGDNTNQVEIQWHSVGNYDVTVNVCGVSNTFPVEVLSLPQPIPVFNDVCPGQTGPVSVVGAYSAYEWRNENGFTISASPTLNLGEGYYEVIVTDGNGCTGNETFYIGNHDEPDVTISTPDFGDFCQNGGTMTLYALETSAGALDYEWFWNGSPFGTNSSSLVISNEGSYFVQVTDANGCTANSNTLILDCGALPPGGGPPGCTPDGDVSFEIIPGLYCNESQYINTSTNDVPGFYQWEFWDVVGGTISYSSAENPTHTWTNAGFNIVVFTAGVNSSPPGQVCLMTTFQFDTIPLVAEFVYEGICGGEPVFFTDVSDYIPQTSITDWAWDFGDPGSGGANFSNLQDPIHVFGNGGFYNVTLTVTDQSGCISEYSSLVEILDPPLASFTIPEQSCEGASLYFEANGNFTDVNWNFGDPVSGAANTSGNAETYHVYTSPGTYNVTLNVENVFGCTETITEQVVIEANDLTGIINVNPALEVCAGDSVILTAPLADSYSWSTGVQTQSVSVFDAGTYEVTIYDDIGCGYTPPPVTIDIIPLPQGQVTAVEYNEYDQPTDYFYNSYETCYGDDVYLTITENPNYTYEWSTGEVTTDISFTEEKDNLLAIGTHDFTVTITDSNTGCTNVVGPFIVIVHPVPENIFITSMPSAPVCENTPTIMSVFNPDANYTYVWNTGEVGTSINTFYAGQYFVRAINQFGCEGESNTLEIVPGPNIDLIPSGCHARCNPDTICLPPVTNVSSFQWYFNGAPIPPPEGNDPDYIATQSGDYWVEMTSFDGCITISDVLTLDLYDGFGTIQGNVYFDLNENGIIDGADTLMTGIPVILQNGGGNLDTLISNINGSFAFSNILSTDYDVFVDTLNIPGGMVAIIWQASASLSGCDDEETMDFLIQFICTNDSNTLDLGACTGETTEFDGTTLNIGDIQDFTYENSLGCDSVVTVTVFELFESTEDVSLQTCTGSTVSYNGTDLPGGSVTDFIFENASGCDSTVTVTVIETDQDSSSIQFAACIGTTITYDGTNLDPGTSTDFFFTSTGGCDSIVTVIVDPLPIFNEVENYQACTGSTIIYDGTALDPGTTTEFNFTSINNCDSTVTVIVSELLPSSGSVDLTACENETVFYDGTELNPGTTTDFTYPNSVGCDSLVTVFVQSIPVSTEMLELTACEGSTVIYDGVALDPGYIGDFTFTNAAGCDSIVTVEVAPLPLYNESLNLSACEGDSVEYDDVFLQPGSSTQFMFQTQAGCDSMVTVFVEELFSSSLTLAVSACEGETYSYNGQNLPAGSSTPFIYTNASGCDSTVFVNVGTWQISEDFIDLFVCSGETIEFNGIELPEGFEDVIVLQDQNGCDSIINVSVTAYPEFFYDVATDADCWNDNSGILTIENLTGGTAPFELSIDGINYQDSLIFNNVDDGTYTVSVIDANGCEELTDIDVNEIQPIEISANIPEIPCDFSPQRLELNIISQNSGPVTFEWETGSVQSFINVDSPGVYTVLISNACESFEEQFTVSLAADARVNFFYVPNVFSPNGDGMNDLWQVQPPDDMEVLSFELQVFDRWGNHLKTFPTVMDNWDGSFKEEDMNPGVYVWWYRATVLSCGRVVEVFDKGDVTIVK